MPARLDDAALPVPLPEQDRSRWDRDAIARGDARCSTPRSHAGAPGPLSDRGRHLRDALPGRRRRRTRTGPGSPALRAPRARAPIRRAFASNRAFAVARAHGARAGLALLDEVAADDAADYPYAHLVRGALLDELGRPRSRGRLRSSARPTRRATHTRRARSASASSASGGAKGHHELRREARHDGSRDAVRARRRGREEDVRRPLLHGQRLDVLRAHQDGLHGAGGAIAIRRSARTALRAPDGLHRSTPEGHGLRDARGPADRRRPRRLDPPRPFLLCHRASKPPHHGGHAGDRCRIAAITSRPCRKSAGRSVSIQGPTRPPKE